MRKLVILGMAVALAVGLTACGSDDDTSSPTATTTADDSGSPCGDTPVPAAALEELSGLSGVLAVRYLPLNG